jgi:DNA-binding NarL/FixJ family response regulator
VTAPAATTVAIVEDHPMYRETITAVVSAMSGLEVLFGVESVDEALALIEEGPSPGLVLVDLWLQGTSGLELVADIRRRWPDVRSIVVSGHRREAYADQALSAGAKGYILKGDPKEFQEGIRQVLDGGTYVSEAVRRTAR